AISLPFLFILSVSLAAPIDKLLAVTEPVPVIEPIGEILLPRKANPSDPQNQAISTANSNGQSSSSSSVAVVNNGEGAQTTVVAPPDKTPDEAQKPQDNKKKETDTIIGSVVGTVFAGQLAVL
ncbi:hypothetical protein BZA77DRAFT_344305, partial [Pyronema omphalodes]